jgi:hypothetical protein
MAFANANFGNFDQRNLRNIMDTFISEAPKRTDSVLYKQYINGTRYVDFVGNAYKINLFTDYSTQRWYKNNHSKAKAITQIPDGIIDVNKQTIVLHDWQLFEEGSQALGSEFYDYFKLSNHWTIELNAGTSDMIRADGFKELKCKNSDVNTWFPGIKIDLVNYNVLNKPPKKLQDIADNWKKLYRLRTNGRARARKGNDRALARLDMYKRTGNADFVEMTDVFKLFNVSDRRKVIDMFGMDTILASCNMKSLNVDTVDERPYELVSVEIEDVGSVKGVRWCNYLRMVNPSTDEIHFEGVPNTATTVKEALGWRDGEIEPKWNGANRERTMEGEYIKPKVLT